jgi:DNA-binding NtrC family response regulator
MVVDDEPTQRRVLSKYLGAQGFDVHQAAAAEEALGALRSERADVVLTDVRLPGTDGVEMIRRARAEGLDAEFLVMTAYGTIDNAVEAMRAGAYDYLTKPLRLDALDAALARVTSTRPPCSDRDDPLADVGPAMRRVRDLIDRVAPSEATVLITGESGSGKEVVADRIQSRSRRSAAPFLRINCAALAESLLEAELFGHAEGAFTGAREARPGLFEAAEGGTVLLDEIGDISAAVQVRLLRVLQEREVTRVGERAPRPVDFRLLAATHRDLDELVREGRFREDLLFRLRVIEIGVPPLRDRIEDVPSLAKRLLLRIAQRHGMDPRPLAKDAVAALVAHTYPGNVRELEHRLERACVLGAGEEIHAGDLELVEGPEPAPPATTLTAAVEVLERDWIERALANTKGVRARAARELGIPERVLRYKLRKYDIRAERRK